MNPYIKFIQNLGKLRESSRHAIIDGESSQLDEFKSNLHVEREVEKQLRIIIAEASKSEKAQLVLICGNVGDGKSHILSHLRSELGEEFSKFSVHNDATEAFNPKESFEDTLDSVLEEFKDHKIGTGSQKLLLAINLGTLNNFLTEKGENFKQLKEYVEEMGILDTDIVEKDNYNKSSLFQYVNFADYQLYELSESGVESEVISKLFENIFSNNKKKNPIYSSYLGLKEHYSSSQCPILYNYEFLLESENRNLIVGLMIKAIVKSKGIVSFRSILNFIHDIIVPVRYLLDTEEAFNKLLTKIQPDEYVQNVLPNYIFEHPELSNIFKIISEEDPCNKRSEVVDDSIIRIVNTEEIEEFAKEFYSERLLNEDLLTNLRKVQNNKQLLSKTHIRLLFFQDSQQYELWDMDYKKYINYLYLSNKGDKQGLKQLYQLVIEACKKWNGNPNEKNSIIIELGTQQKKYRILKEFKPVPIFSNKEDSEKILKRFSPQLCVQFKGKDSIKNILNIDCGLLKLLNQVNNGYRPNKLDKNSYVNFINFLNNLIVSDNESKDIKIDEVNIGKSIDYNFSIDAFGEYKFEKNR